MSFTEVDIDIDHSLYLVYSNSLSLDKAISPAYTAATEVGMKEWSLLLRKIMMNAFDRHQPAQHWLPSAYELLSKLPHILPLKLKTFLQHLTTSCSERTSRQAEGIVLSIGKWIYRAVSGGERKIPKHVLSCTIFNHMFRGKWRLGILNCFGIHSTLQ